MDRQHEIRWPKAFLTYSGYPAKEHVEEFLALPDRDKLFTDIFINQKGDLVLILSNEQLDYYKKKYQGLLQEAQNAAVNQGVYPTISGDYHRITYEADSYDAMLQAVTATAKTELFASCLQFCAGADQEDWSLEIVIRNRLQGRVVAAAHLPEESLAYTEKMWEAGDDAA